jgi:glycosyltransferase involved in cell wall biosynthesis
MGEGAPSARVAIVLKGYPRLSETFIAQELSSLERRGLAFTIWSMRRPTDGKRHPVHDAIRAAVTYLPEYLHQEPARVFRAWRKARRLPGHAVARRAFLADLRRDPTRNRVRRFGQAMVLAAEMEEGVTSIYAHFLHTPGSVARYAALMRGLPWSCSAHAKDIYTQPVWEKAGKLASLDWLVTCTQANVEHLQSVARESDRSKISLLYHGLDLTRFPPPPASRLAPTPPTILSVGRAVEKKGYDVLLEALSRLPAGLDWRFRHVGGGEGLSRLKGEAERLRIAHRIDWLGACAQDEVLAEYRAADLFVLASRVARDGDRDGLPNVLMEAQSQRLACVATRVSAIPELIEDGVTGLLVPPDDPDALAHAMDRLLSDPGLRLRLGEAGQMRVHDQFSHEASIGALARRFGLTGAARTDADADRLLRAAQRA